MPLKEKKSIKRLMQAFYPLLIFVFCGLGTFFSYLYGYSSSGVQLYSNYMAMDAEIKSGNNGGFLHGSLKYDSNLSTKDTLTSSLAYQLKTMYKNKYYNSYLLSAVKDEPVTYDVLTGIEGYNPKINLTMVRNFWDSSYMDGIALPLFWTNNNIGHNGIRPRNESANFGSYLSSTMAYEFVKANGMLAKNNNDVAAAFTELINDNTYFYTLSTDAFSIEIKMTFTINNIFIDSEDFYNLLLDNEQKAQNKYYENYYKNFSYWNPNTILTYSQQIFSKGNIFKFDIKENFKNTELFVNDVLGERFQSGGSTIEFETRSRVLDDNSKRIDGIAKNRSNPNIVILLIAILYFQIALVLHIFNLSSTEKKKSRKRNIFELLLPCLPFLIFQLALCSSLIIGTNLVFYYSVFNYVGNIVIIISLVSITISGFVWRTE